MAFFAHHAGSLSEVWNQENVTFIMHPVKPICPGGQENLLLEVVAIDHIGGYADLE
jgi:hypothetical protein